MGIDDFDVQSHEVILPHTILEVVLSVPSFQLMRALFFRISTVYTASINVQIQKKMYYSKRQRRIIIAPTNLKKQSSKSFILIQFGCLQLQLPTRLSVNLTPSPSPNFGPKKQKCSNDMFLKYQKHDLHGYYQSTCFIITILVGRKKWRRKNPSPISSKEREGRSRYSSLKSSAPPDRSNQNGSRPIDFNEARWTTTSKAPTLVLHEVNNGWILSKC